MQPVTYVNPDVLFDVNTGPFGALTAFWTVDE